MLNLHNLEVIRIQVIASVTLDLCVCYLAQELPINPVNPDLAMISATRRLLRITLGYVMLHPVAGPLTAWAQREPEQGFLDTLQCGLAIAGTIAFFVGLLAVPPAGAIQWVLYLSNAILGPTSVGTALVTQCLL